MTLKWGWPGTAMGCHIGWQRKGFPPGPVGGHRAHIGPQQDAGPALPRPMCPRPPAASLLLMPHPLGPGLLSCPFSDTEASCAPWAHAGRQPEQSGVGRVLGLGGHDPHGEARCWLCVAWWHQGTRVSVRPWKMEGITSEWMPLCLEPAVQLWAGGHGSLGLSFPSGKAGCGEL